MAITGTSKGIGRAIAEHFAGRGYGVFGCSRGPSTLEVEGYHHSRLDIGEENQVRDWVRLVKRTGGRIDALVCNAGFMPGGVLMTLTQSDTLDRVLHTMFKGTYYVCREIAKVMILQRLGRIVAISSAMAGVHAEGTSAYSAAKSAVDEMIKVLAKELASTGVTCNAIAPGLVMTEAAQDLGINVTAQVLERQTIKRAITVPEICHALEFFLAPESSCITGQVLYLGAVV